MNTPIDEKLVRKEWELLTSSDTVEVKIGVRWKYGICFPCKSDEKPEDEIVTTFKRMTVEDYEMIERPATSYITYPETSVVIDYEIVKALTIRRMLKGWTLPIPLVFEDSGWMSDASFARVMSLPAPLLMSMFRKYEKDIIIDEEEERTISKQSAILFSKNSRGVAGACAAVSLFCNLTNFWEKFGLNRFDLRKLSYREYLYLRIMSSNDAEAHAAAIRASQVKSKAQPTMRGRRGVGSPVVIEG